MDKNKTQALIKLLDDPNNEIFNTIRQNLIAEGESIIPELELAWETTINELQQKRIENIIKLIQFEIIKTGLAKWKNDENHNLLLGAFFIAKYQYPELKYSELKSNIDKISQDVWLEINENLTALEKVKVLNHIFFNIHKFSNNEKNIPLAQSNYINNVLSTKNGNAITLSFVYSIVAQDIKIPIYPVSLPKNYILAYKEKYSALQAFKEDSNTILFYINAYNRGAVFGRKVIETFIAKQKIEERTEYFIPCSNVDNIKHLLSNLISIYEKNSEQEKVDDLLILKNILTD